ncbi:MAG: Nitrogenase (molybdenum-iron)-specific transcriptional regulator NifA, partial [Labilithrix sp.]|nr:Nitrogenase (molybdenum-iron)-specific transcriptional regulator NifA [Labilithrix sp.]
MSFAARIAPPPEDAMEIRDVSDGFARFDRVVVAAEPGALVVRTRDENLEAILAHASRRLRAAGCRTVEVRLRPPASIFREAATQLGLGALACDARTYASALTTLAQGRVAIVAPLPKEGSWDEAVARELAELRGVVLVLATASIPPSWANRTSEVTADLTLEERRRWIEAVARDGESLLRHRELHELEAWWRQALRESVPWEAAPRAPAPSRLLSTAELELATVVALARRSIPLAALQRLPGEAALVRTLVETGVVVESGHAVVLGESVDGAALESLASPELRERTVRLLLGEGDAFARDPWACARAAELLVGQRPLDADAAMDRAARYARDARITSELTEHWRATLDNITGETGIELRIRAAERAIGTGKPLDALRWCDSIVDAGSRRARVQLATARAHVQLGDLVSATLVLGHIRQEDADDELRATIAVERGEIGYLMGDHETARNESETALRLARLPQARLAARSVLGKLLLARGEWDAADGHFAADAIAAQSAGEATADLRARLNRGIALASKGFLDEARQTLVRVREDADRLGEHRASALALSNLGFVASRQRDFMGALHYWEERLNQCDSLGGRAAAALPTANLADLRLMLGLVDRAEHAVRFGRKIIAGSLTPARAAHFERVAAAVALARGATDVAEREVQNSIKHARASGDVQDVGDAAIVGARIALADGDLRRVDDWLRLAEENARTARAVADIALLRALQLRALGRPALQAAQRALELARAAEDYDLVVEVHVLIATAARDEPDLDLARSHASRAVEIRDRIAASLTPVVRTAFLGKQEMRALAKLVASLGDAEAEPNVAETTAPLPPLSPRSSRDGNSRERMLVGTHRRMKSLEVAIRKAALSDSTILIHGESGT